MNTKRIVQLAIVTTGLIGQVIAMAQPETLENEPGPIQHTPTDGVSGSFKLKKSQGGTWSTGSGGGCLVADFSASLGESQCMTHADCVQYKDLFLSQLPAGTTAEGAYGYCAQPDNTNEPKRCWVRPGSQAKYCHISPTAPLPLNHAVQLPKAPDKGYPAHPLNDGKKVRWMVYTCLNGFDFSQPQNSKDLPGCKESDANMSTSQGGKAKALDP